MNDPFTAMSAVDHLGSALCRLAGREMTPPYSYDGQGQLRPIMPVFSFADVADAACNPIRQQARCSTAVTLRLLETLAVVVDGVHRSEERAALLRHAEMIRHGARSGLPEYADRQEVEARFLSIKHLG
ncbi:DUF2254 family protein [Magnetovirga frankeli]|uniref:DUF2254 family protein n=1 Tax=Magnetovirga frankeli TaxID=947516 RepID=UPI003D330BDF